MSVVDIDFLPPLLVKGLVWMALCGLAALALHGCRRAGGKIWRTALASLALLSGIGLLPAVWTWPLVELSTTTTAAVTGEEAFPFIPMVVENELSGQEPSDTPVLIGRSPSTGTAWPWDQLLFLLWAGGAGGLGVWLAAGFATVRRWIRAGVPLTEEGWRESLAQECRSMGMRRPPRLLASASVPGPCAAGWWRPVILLPGHCRDWDGEMRRIVLRHELSHIRGGDLRQAWIRAAVLMVHWMNPLVWLASSRSRRAEELTADATVLAGEAVTPERYAAVLLTVARSCQLSACSPLSLHHPILTAMANPSTLEHRLRHILTQPSPLSRPAGPARFASAGVGAALLGAVLLGCGSIEGTGHRSTDMLPGAETPQAPIRVGELKKLVSAEPSGASEFRVTYRVVDSKGQLIQETFLRQGGGPMTLAGQVTLGKGRTGKVERTREFPVPTGFDPPQFTSDIGHPSGGTSFPVTPSTPQWAKDLEFPIVGWSLEKLKARPQGASVVVSGVFRETVCDGFIRNAGEVFSPIITDDEAVVLTDNKVLSPSFSSRETQFLTATLPGKSYRTRLNLRQPGAFLEITCDPLEK